MKPDPIVTEVREARHRISARFGHDTERLAAHYKELDEELRQSGEFQFVTGFFSVAPEKTTAADRRSDLPSASAAGC